MGLKRYSIHSQGEETVSEHEVRFESVKIPGEITSNPIPLPITVSFPIVARPRRWLNFLFGSLALVNGLIMAALAVACLVFLPYLEFSWDFRKLLADSLIIASIPLCLPYGVMMLGAAVTCFKDGLQSQKIVLEITADGLRDHRSGLDISWSTVQCANISGRTNGVDLRLHDAKVDWQNPFRIGVVFQRWWPKSDHVIVSVGLVDVRPHLLIYSILTQVHWHGGETVGVSTYRYSSLIPRPGQPGVKPVV